MTDNLLNIALVGASKYPMEYEHVVSTNISTIAFIPTVDDGAIGVIVVRFNKSDQVYVYGDCSKEDYLGLFNTEDNSVGKAFYKTIRTSKPTLAITNTAATFLSLLAHNTELQAQEAPQEEFYAITQYSDEEIVYKGKMCLTGQHRAVLLASLYLQELSEITEEQVAEAKDLNITKMLEGENV